MFKIFMQSIATHTETVIIDNVTYEVWADFDTEKLIIKYLPEETTLWTGDLQEFLDFPNQNLSEFIQSKITLVQ
jgi:hypothetical protein